MKMIIRPLHYYLCIITILLITTVHAGTYFNKYFRYIFPKPNAHFVSTETTLIFCLKEEWKQKVDLSQIDLKISGQYSGKHDGKLSVTDDQTTLIFIPFERFKPDEKVRVEISLNNITQSKPATYEFTTSRNVVSDNNHNEILSSEYSPIKIGKNSR